MGRRRRRRSSDSQFIFPLILALGFIWLIEKGFQFFGGGGASLLLLVAVVAGLYYYGQVIARRKLFQKVENAINVHIGVLTRKRRQLIWEDAYGKPQVDGWQREINYFITHQITPLLASDERSAFEHERETIRRIIENRVSAATQAQPAIRVFSDGMTPTEFEHFCAEELRQFGWNTLVTKQTGDQGVDVIAEKAELRVVVQCKLYSQPVGNKAVQEAATARSHEQATHAIVVTNSRYTLAAKQLASTNNVLLLHYRDLPDLESLLRR